MDETQGTTVKPDSAIVEQPADAAPETEPTQTKTPEATPAGVTADWKTKFANIPERLFGETEAETTENVATAYRELEKQFTQKRQAEAKERLMSRLGGKAQPAKVEQPTPDDPFVSYLISEGVEAAQANATANYFKKATEIYGSAVAKQQVDVLLKNVEENQRHQQMKEFIDANIAAFENDEVSRVWVEKVQRGYDLADALSLATRGIEAQQTAAQAQKKEADRQAAARAAGGIGVTPPQSEPSYDVNDWTQNPDHPVNKKGGPAGW